jgi:hypothetical protein
MDIDLGSFGDCRRQKAGSFLLDSLVKHGASRVNVRALGGNRAGELRITRFLCYPKVKPGVMFDTAAARTATLVRAAISWQYRPAPGLDPGDTTTLRDDGGQRSLELHPTSVTPTLLDAQEIDPPEGVEPAHGVLLTTPWIASSRRAPSPALTATAG